MHFAALPERSGGQLRTHASAAAQFQEGSIPARPPERCSGTVRLLKIKCLIIYGDTATNKALGEEKKGEKKKEQKCRIQYNGKNKT